MYTNASNELMAYINQLGGRSFKSKIELVKNGSVVDIQAQKIVYNGGSNGEENLTVGSTVSANIEITINGIGKINAGNEIRYYVGAEWIEEVDSGTQQFMEEYIPMGIFKVEKPKTDGYITTIKAYDRMKGAERPFKSQYEYPVTTNEIMQEISTKLGIDFATEIEDKTIRKPKTTEENTSNKAFEGYTIREVIGYIASLYGKFAIFNREGQLEFKWYSFLSEMLEIPVSKCYSFTRAENDYVVQKVIGIDANDTQYVEGEGATGISFSNPIITQQNVADIYGVLANYTYRAGEVRFLGNPLVDAWDELIVYDLFDNMYTLIPMTLRHEIDGGITTIVTATSSSDENIEDSFKGPTTRALERTHAELLLVNQLMADKASISYLESNYIQTKELDVISANIQDAVIENIDGKYASIETIEVINADIQVLEAEKVSTNNLSAEVANLGYVTAEQIAGQYASFDYLQSNYATITQLNAVNVVVSEKISASEADLRYADIGLGNIDIANVGKFFADSGLIDRATIVNGHITGYLDSVEVNANSITAGTLITDRLVFRGQQKSIVYELNNINGALQAVQSETLNGEILTDRTVNADKIIAKSITSTEIDVDELVANNAVIKAISTNEVVVGANATANEALNLSKSFGNSTGSPVLLTDSANGNVIDFSAYGKSTQNGTPTPDNPIEIISVGDSGYFDGELLQGYYSATNGVYTSSSNYVCNKNPISCKKGDIVTLSYENYVSRMTIIFYDEYGNFINSSYVGSENKITVTAPDNASYVNFSINLANITPANAGKIIVTINGMYALIVKSVNKNLFNANGRFIPQNSSVSASTNDNTITVAGKMYLYQLIKVKPNTDYYISGSTDSYTVYARVAVYDRDIKTRIVSTVGNTIGKLGLNFNSGNNTEIAVLLYAGNETAGVSVYSSIQIEQGTVTTDYVPHKSHTVYIPIKEPLRGIGNVKDEITCIDGVYGVIRKIAETRFDGSETWGDTTQVNDVYRRGILVADMKMRYNGAICTHFKTSDAANFSTINEVCFATHPTQQRMFFFTEFATSDEWATWLQANPIKVVYELAEETFTPFEDQTPFKDIKTFNPITYITASNDAEMEVKYYRNTQTGQELSDMNGNIKNWASANDITLIDGGKIYTKSIKADSIDINNIFAQDITATGTITGATLKGAKIYTGQMLHEESGIVDVLMELGADNKTSSGIYDSLTYQVNGIDISSNITLNATTYIDELYIGGIGKTLMENRGASYTYEVMSGILSPTNKLALLSYGDIEIVDFSSSIEGTSIFENYNLTERFNNIESILGTLSEQNINYFKMGNYAVQWGTVTLNTRVTDKQVYAIASFEIPFVDSSYSIIATSRISNSYSIYYDTELSTAGKTINSANIRAYSPSSAFTTTNFPTKTFEVDWVAIGKIA